MADNFRFFCDCIFLDLSVTAYLSVLVLAYRYADLYYAAGFPALDICIHYRAKQTGEAVIHIDWIYIRFGAARRRIFRGQLYGAGIHVGAILAHRLDRLSPEKGLGFEDLCPGVGGASRLCGGNGLVGVRTNHTDPERTLWGTCQVG